MSIVEHRQTYLEKTRPQRVNALMWIAEHAGILADGYAVSTSGGYFDDERGLVGDVSVQGERGDLQSLVARLGAVPELDQRDDNYRVWVAFDEGVRIRLIEETDVRA